MASPPGWLQSISEAADHAFMTDQHVLRLVGLRKTFGPIVATDELSLEVKRGEIFTLLGPSGCGKTTALRLIAGLERPDRGDIYIGDRLVVSAAKRVFVPAHKRGLGMVFQSYAIWPHLTVFENVAYPLRARGVRGATLRDKVGAALELVGLQGLEERPGPLLSGGQQQRVALARGLVFEPELLLLDEPFSNLDAKLREHMRVEVKRIQRRVGITVVFVTHDQVEALSLSDRLAVLESGRLMQVGSPRELYDKPQNGFVRDFLGKSVVLRGQLTGVADGGGCEVTIASGGDRTFRVKHVFADDPAAGEKVFVAVRPEDVAIEADAGGSQNSLEGTIDTLLFVGDRCECHVRLGDGSPVVAYLPRHTTWQEGQTVQLKFPVEALSAWPR